MSIRLNKYIQFRLLCYPIILLLVFTVSCEKPEGPGGKGSIKGQVIEKTFDRGFRVLQSEKPAGDEDVYIIYGSSNSVSDDRKTTPDGLFDFQYLSKGDYTVYVYSVDSSANSASATIPVSREVNLSSNKDKHDLGTIEIFRTMDLDEGDAVIMGQISKVNYARDFAYIKDTVDSQDLEVFLLYEDDLHYTERIRTLYDGSFAFPNLIIGKYTIFFYADDITGGSNKIPVETKINVDALQGVYDTGVLYQPVED